MGLVGASGAQHTHTNLFGIQQMKQTLLTLLIAPLLSAGTITTFSDRTTFNTAVGPVVVDDFGAASAFPIPGGVLDNTTNTATTNGGPILAGRVNPGATYSVEPPFEGFFFNIDSGGGFAGGFLSGFVRPNGGANPLTVAFNGPASAFGFDTNSLMGSSFALTIRFSNGPDYQNSFNVPVVVTPLTFFGFQSSAADIESIVIASSSSRRFSFALDNFAHNAGDGTVPEPSTWAMMAGGVAWLAWRRRR